MTKVIEYLFSLYNSRTKMFFRKLLARDFDKNEITVRYCVSCLLESSSYKILCGCTMGEISKIKFSGRSRWECDVNTGCEQEAKKNIFVYSGKL